MARHRKGVSGAIVAVLLIIIGAILALMIYQNWGGFTEASNMVFATATGDYKWVGNKPYHTITVTIENRGDVALTLQKVELVLVDVNGNQYTIEASYDPNVGQATGTDAAGVWSMTMRGVQKINPQSQVTYNILLIPQLDGTPKLSTVSITFVFVDDDGNTVTTSADVSF